MYFGEDACLRTRLPFKNKHFTKIFYFACLVAVIWEVDLFLVPCIVYSHLFYLFTDEFVLILKREQLSWLYTRKIFVFFHCTYLKYLVFPCGSAGKEFTCNVGDLGLIPGLGRFPGEGKRYPLQYSGLENSMDSIVHGGLKESDTTEWLSLNVSQAWISVIDF